VDIEVASVFEYYEIVFVTLVVPEEDIFAAA
jgi:hypothetical protein